MKRIYIAGNGIRSHWVEDALAVGCGKTRGGVAFINNRMSFVIEDGIYLFNHVQMDGGCLYLLDCSNVVIRNNTFMFNKAKWGGAIYLERCSDVLIYGNSFISNLALRDGGAISLSRCEYVTIHNNSFALNAGIRSAPKVDIHNCKTVCVSYL